MQSVLLAPVAPVASLASTPAAMLDDVRNHTIACGMDFFQFPPYGALHRNFTKADVGVFVCSGPDAVIENSDHPLVVGVKPPAPIKLTKLIFRKSDKGCSFADDDVDDASGLPCEFSSDNSVIQENRRNVVRENVRRNDPMAECESVLIRYCGMPASQNFAKGHSAALKRITQTALKKMRDIR